MRKVGLILILVCLGLSPVFAQETSRPIIMPENADEITLLYEFEVATQPDNNAYRENALAFSPDSKMLAVGLLDRLIRLYDLETEEMIELVGHTDSVWSVAFSPNGSMLASGAYDSTVRLWNVATGEELYTFTGPTGWINSVAFSPDGTLIAAGEADNKVWVWSVATHETVFVLEGHTGYVADIAFSPAGDLLASAGGDGLICLWDLTTGEQKQVLTGHYLSVETLAFNIDGSILASGGSDTTVRLWDIAQGTQRSVLQSHIAWINGLSFSPYGRILASSGGTTGNKIDETVYLWDVATGEEISYLETGNRVSDVKFSPDGKLIATGQYGYVDVWGIDRDAVEPTAPDSPGSSTSQECSITCGEIFMGIDVDYLYIDFTCEDPLQVQSTSNEDTALASDGRSETHTLTETRTFPETGHQYHIEATWILDISTNDYFLSSYQATVTGGPFAEPQVCSK
ncbi:MAG: WD40 repeat domain-containing protein [Chloroflexi bacterium]|nr:WD40 repeat domain-containing protein [Chloroflexota bacterium]